MKTVVYPNSERGVKDIGWLQSNFTFSFSSYVNPARSGFGALRVFNDDVVQPGGGFGLHPHANMEIISLLLAGKMNHKDSMGYADVVERDWVQIMSAGSGLRHEEWNVGEEPVNFLQIWIEPKVPNITPRYQRRHFPEEKRHNRLVTVVSNDEGLDHCWINQNARISLGYFDAGHEVRYAFNPVNKAVFIFNIAGGLEAAGYALAERDAVGVWDTPEVVLHTMSETRFLVIEIPVN